jgi:glycosyltransferase involved in cell wall biosynthesis
VDLHLLGIYEANGHLSIRNYFEYCVAELPAFLPEWRILSSKPGQTTNAFTPGDNVRRLESWFENYIAWPLRLRGLRGNIFHIVDQSIAWYRPFIATGRIVVTVHDLINIMMMHGQLDLGRVPRLRSFKMMMCIQQMRKADALVCVSTNTADCVRRELGVPSHKVHVIHNIIASDFHPASPQERNQLRYELFGKAEFVILHVGKPSHYKNRIGVMEIFRRIRQRFPECKLAITGAPLTKAEVAVLADTSLLNAVSVHLPAKREQIRNLYCASDLLLFPSLYEGFGWPPIEAMACDCPVVSSSCGSLSEVVGQGGVLIRNPHDHDAFVDAACNILRDSVLRRTLIMTGRTNALRFAKHMVLPKLADVYRGLS